MGKGKKTNEIKETILKFLYVYGKARSVDVVRFANYRYETCARGSALCKELLESGLVVEVTYSLSVSAREGRRVIKDKVFAISPLGEEYVSKKYPGLKAKGEYIRQGQVLPKESAALDRRLTDRGILLNFLAVGIPVFMDEKPSLDHLLKGLGNILNERADIPKGYMDNLSDEECASFLRNRLDKNTGEVILGGAYYTIKEFTGYIKRNETLADTFTGTRVRGIYISSTTCYLVYTPKRFSNKMLSVKYKSEKALLTALKKTFMHTDIYRRIKELSMGNNIRENRPAAIIFSDGKRLAYEMATGDIRGQRKGKSDMVQIVTDLEKYNAMHEDELSTTYLTSGSSLFDDMYVIPMSLNGLDALSYLVANSKENLIKDAKSVIESIPDFYKASGETGLYPYHNRKYIGNRAFPEYVPVINVKQMRWIREAGGVPFIITDKDLLDPVAHSIKLPAIYYNPGDGTEYSKNAVFIYNENGEIAGLDILRRCLKERELTFETSFEWSEIYKRLGMSHIELYNKIARSEIDIESVIEVTKTKKAALNKPKKKKYKSTTILLDEEQYSYISEMAKTKNKSISYCLRSLIEEERKKY